MTTYEIPLVANQNQKLTISLSGVQYTLIFNWVNVDQGGWTVDIMDNTNVPIIQGIPLITGADLLAQYAYLNLGGQLIVQSDAVLTDVPTYSDLGRGSHLYYVTVDA